MRAPVNAWAMLDPVRCKPCLSLDSQLVRGEAPRAPTAPSAVDEAAGASGAVGETSGWMDEGAVACGAVAGLALRRKKLNMDKPEREWGRDDPMRQRQSAILEVPSGVGSRGAPPTISPVVIQRRQLAAPAAPPREVRLIGGRWKRSKLPVLDKPGLRPTPDRVRETLFNWLGQELTGLRVLDAFAGSGALGFEAASRGARQVLLLEQDAALVRSLRESVTRLGGQASIEVKAGEALAWMRSAASAGERFDLIFLDPPFSAGLFDEGLAAAQRVLTEGGLVYLEADREFDAPSLPPALSVWRHARAGQVHYHLLRQSPANDPPSCPSSDRSAP